MTERVWDKFLTDHDKENLALRGPKERTPVTNPAILLIDLYRGVFGDKPEELNEAIKTWSGSCGMFAWNALPHIERLIATGREAGIPIVHVTGLDPALSGVERHSKQMSLDDPSLDAAGRDRRLRRYDFIDEATPLTGEAIIKKSGPSAFWGTPLASHLFKRGITSLIVAGESTSGCVRASVAEADAYHFNVVIAEECVFDRHEAPHAMNLFDMHQKYATVVPVEEAIGSIPMLASV